VLNAFRHHWNLHTLRFFRPNTAASMCSTPFGIIGIFTKSGATFTWKATACSTPFGIIGIFTTGAGATNPGETSAQRLSASLESSPARVMLLSSGLYVCSTPFGIIGIFTLAVTAEPFGALMCSTPFGIIGIFTRGCGFFLNWFAVLNAFRHHWNLHPPGR